MTCLGRRLVLLAISLCEITKSHIYVNNRDRRNCRSWQCKYPHKHARTYICALWLCEPKFISFNYGSTWLDSLSLLWMLVAPKLKWTCQRWQAAAAAAVVSRWLYPWFLYWRVNEIRRNWINSLDSGSNRFLSWTFFQFTVGNSLYYKIRCWIVGFSWHQGVATTSKYGALHVCVRC